MIEKTLPQQSLAGLNASLCWEPRCNWHLEIIFQTKAFVVGWHSTDIPLAYTYEATLAYFADANRGRLQGGRIMSFISTIPWGWAPFTCSRSPFFICSRSLFFACSWFHLLFPSFQFMWVMVYSNSRSWDVEPPQYVTEYYLSLASSAFSLPFYFPALTMFGLDSVRHTPQHLSTLVP